MSITRITSDLLSSAKLDPKAIPHAAKFRQCAQPLRDIAAGWRQRWQEWRLSPHKLRGQHVRLENAGRSCAKDWADAGLHRRVTARTVCGQERMCALDLPPPRDALPSI